MSFETPKTDHQPTSRFRKIVTGTSLEMNHFLRSTALIVGLFVLCGVCAADKPNVVFIMTDQQFGDAMSCRMGKQFIHTPATDSLARNGMLFTRAYSPNPLCMPARNSIFTGRYPHETGVTKNGRGQIGNNQYDFPNMGTYFKQAGYQTAYFGKTHLLFKVEDSFHNQETQP